MAQLIASWTRTGLGGGCYPPACDHGLPVGPRRIAVGGCHCRSVWGLPGCEPAHNRPIIHYESDRNKRNKANNIVLLLWSRRGMVFPWGGLYSRLFINWPLLQTRQQSRVVGRAVDRRFDRWHLCPMDRLRRGRLRLHSCRFPSVGWPLRPLGKRHVPDRRRNSPGSGAIFRAGTWSQAPRRA
jgi:hypothetical protein